MTEKMDRKLRICDVGFQEFDFGRGGVFEIGALVQRGAVLVDFFRKEEGGGAVAEG